MKYRIKNISQGRRGVEKAGGGYVWIEPGAEKTIDVADPKGVERDAALETEARADLAPPPASLAAKVTPKPATKPSPFDHDGDGKPGGSRRGRASTSATGARRRRRKAASR